MRVLVGVKRVVDYAVKVRVQPDKAGTSHRRNNDICLFAAHCGALMTSLFALYRFKQG